MTFDNNNCIIPNKTVWIRQFFSVTFLSSSEVSVLLNISSSLANNNLPSRCFSHEQFLISKYLTILQALLHSQFYMLGFHIWSSS